MRRKTIEDADSLQNISLCHSNSIESQSSTVQQLDSFGDGPQAVDTRKCSISFLAKGLARHVPDMRMFASPEKATESRGDAQRRFSQDAVYTKTGPIDRKISVPVVKASQLGEPGPKAPAVPEKILSTPSQNKEILEPPEKGSLRDRRKVKLDLSMPTEMPDVSVRGRSPAVALSSVTPSRPRSPKTPWIRNEQPRWVPGPTMNTAPIVEEEYIQESIKDEDDRGHGGADPQPVTSVMLPSQSPKFE